MDDATEGKDLFDDDNDESEDEAEFEAKRAKDAENKVIKDIFGGKVEVNQSGKRTESHDCWRS